MSRNPPSAGSKVLLLWLWLLAGGRAKYPVQIPDCPPEVGVSRGCVQCLGMSDSGHSCWAHLVLRRTQYQGRGQCVSFIAQFWGKVGLLRG